MEEKMNTNSIDAYDLPERVRTYDTDMEIMHPLRWKMIEIALEVLPFRATEYVNVLDLGVGTGCFPAVIHEMSKFKISGSRWLCIDDRTG